MLTETTIIRLLISQAFAVYFLLILIPLKEPKKINVRIIILGAIIITLMNAVLIVQLGITFYIRFYFLTLILPYVILYWYVAVYKGAKLIFALLSIQVITNVTIINGLLASYVFYGENNPIVDTIARVMTYLLFLPILFRFIRPTYLKMVEVLNKGWWVLNTGLIFSYALAYFILFVPDTIFDRPEYFPHAYIGIFLSLLIYAIIFFLFIEVQSKFEIERDKQQLSMQVSSLTAQSAEINTIAYQDTLTGINNRYSLYRRMDQLIQNKQPFLVVFIDLDNLKEINDTFDHSKGDYYLKEFASAIQSAVHQQGEVYRFAGDEFVCLMMQERKAFDQEEFRENIASQITLDVPFNGLSLGLAQYPDDGLSVDDLISLADQAMYTEKRAKHQRR